MTGRKLGPVNQRGEVGGGVDRYVMEEPTPEKMRETVRQYGEKASFIFPLQQKVQDQGDIEDDHKNTSPSQTGGKDTDENRPPHLRDGDKSKAIDSSLQKNVKKPLSGKSRGPEMGRNPSLPEIQDVEPFLNEFRASFPSAQNPARGIDKPRPENKNTSKPTRRQGPLTSENSRRASQVGRVRACWSCWSCWLLKIPVRMKFSRQALHFPN
ncbi:hypothetical protein BDZ45DRAFT_696433 [Acephala macrosclerotiorum]|nr:hypothetical protein BDZ45DRAFT_696433 [Acephala macrosclerotiorum]